MILNEDSGIGDYQIRAYEPGAVTVNETVYTKSLIVSAYKLVADWAPQSLDELKNEDFKPILEVGPEIVLLGTGISFKMPAQKQLAPLYLEKLGVECMDTGAACRTYTALMSEGRKVVAALLIK